jgi:hypothetical protein
MDELILTQSFIRIFFPISMIQKLREIFCIVFEYIKKYNKIISQTPIKQLYYESAH